MPQLSHCVMCGQRLIYQYQKFGMEATPQTFFGGRNVALTTTIRSTVSAIHVKMLCGSHPTFVLIDPK